VPLDSTRSEDRHYLSDFRNNQTNYMLSDTLEASNRHIMGSGDLPHSTDLPLEDSFIMGLEMIGKVLYIVPSKYGADYTPCYVQETALSRANSFSLPMPSVQTSFLKGQERTLAELVLAASGRDPVPYAVATVNAFNAAAN